METGNNCGHTISGVGGCGLCGFGRGCVMVCRMVRVCECGNVNDCGGELMCEGVECCRGSGWGSHHGQWCRTSEDGLRTRGGKRVRRCCLIPQPVGGEGKGGLVAGGRRQTDR